MAGATGEERNGERDGDLDGDLDGGHGRRPRVAVVGAGISGLTAAWRLVTGPEPPEVVVLEQAERVGGKLLVGRVGGVEVDLGAESVLARRPEAVGLAREVGLAADLVHPAVAGASVVRGGRLHPLPAGTVMGVPGGVAGLAGVLEPEEVARVAAEPGLPARPLTHDVDVASWVAARVGPAVVDRLVEPLLGGVYAGRADALSLQATVPALWRQAQAGGSLLEAVQQAVAAAGGGGARPQGPVFAGLRGGVGRLATTLADELTRRGVAVLTGRTVRGLTRTHGGWRLLVGPVPDERALDVDAVVLAVPAAAAARLLREVAPAAAAELGAVRSASVALVTAVVAREALAGLPGTGVLVPPVEGRPVKAMTFSSAKWAWVGAPDRERAVVRMSLGRAGEEATLQRDDGDLTSLALADAADLLGRPLDAEATAVVRWGGGLPQYAVGHVDRVARLRSALAPLPGLAVCGAALDGVGVPACIATADRAAGEIREHLATAAAAAAAEPRAAAAATGPARPAGARGAGSEWMP